MLQFEKKIFYLENLLRICAGKETQFMQIINVRQIPPENIYRNKSALKSEQIRLKAVGMFR